MNTEGGIALREDIIKDMQQGSREAFNELFRHYYPRVMAYVSSLMEEDIAEDITQDVFLYVWENRKKLHFGGGFHSYLFQSAYTRCLDYLKKNRSAEKYAAQTFDAHTEYYATLLKGDCQVLDELYKKDFYHHLYTLLDEIPPERREVFMLAYINGLKSQEIAEFMHMPQRTVESHLYLALKYLKAHMSRKDFFLLCLMWHI